MKRVFYLIFIIITGNITRSYAQEYTILHFTSSHTSFPDTGRINGYLYDSVLYDASSHYSDSSVLIVVPKTLNPKNNIDIIFWFHGWRNSIDSAAIRYELLKQFIASECNAVLVLAETAKNSPDSYGGKLEQMGMFKNLVNDVMNELKEKKFISKRCDPGNIMLAGHSGAYRVMAYILQNGGIGVQEIILFDALYSQTDKFINWIQQDSSHRFINLYTNTGGGTDEVSLEMLQEFRIKNIQFVLTEEKKLYPELLRSTRVVFIHSEREHNDIINHPDNFQLVLETSNSFERIK